MWTACCTITQYARTAARPRATPALPAPLGRHTAVTPPSTGPEMFTDVSFLTHLLNYTNEAE